MKRSNLITYYTYTDSDFQSRISMLSIKNESNMLCTTSIERSTYLLYSIFRHWSFKKVPSSSRWCKYNVQELHFIKSYSFSKVIRPDAYLHKFIFYVYIYFFNQFFFWLFLLATSSSGLLILSFRLKGMYKECLSLFFYFLKIIFIYIKLRLFKYCGNLVHSKFSKTWGFFINLIIKIRLCVCFFFNLLK